MINPNSFIQNHDIKDIVCDYLVVGSGAGGGVAAYEISKTKNVLLIEEGKYFEIDNFKGSFKKSLKAWRNGGFTPVIGTPSFGYGEGMCLGGSTYINGGLIWRTPNHILEKWNLKQIDGYNFLNLKKHFLKIEKMLNVNLENNLDKLNNSSQIIHNYCINNNIKSVYAATKKTMEFISDVYCKIYKLKFIGMRFFTVYGPYGRPDMSIFKFFNNIIKNKKIDVYNYGNHERSFTYIDDIIFNINKIILHSKKNIKIKDSKFYNIGNPQTVNLLRLIKLIEKIIKKNVKINFMPFQTGDVLKTKANIGKDENKLGFRFKINIEQGVKNFYKWFINER
jgi:hypothetical protein